MKNSWIPGCKKMSAVDSPKINIFAKIFPEKSNMQQCKEYSL